MEKKRSKRQTNRNFCLRSLKVRFYDNDEYTEQNSKILRSMHK